MSDLVAQSITNCNISSTFNAVHFAEEACGLIYDVSALGYADHERFYPTLKGFIPPYDRRIPAQSLRYDFCGRICTGARSIEGGCASQDSKADFDCAVLHHLWSSNVVEAMSLGGNPKCSDLCRAIISYGYLSPSFGCVIQKPIDPDGPTEAYRVTRRGIERPLLVGTDLEHHSFISTVAAFCSYVTKIYFGDELISESRVNDTYTIYNKDEVSAICVKFVGIYGADELLKQSGFGTYIPDYSGDLNNPLCHHVRYGMSYGPNCTGSRTSNCDIIRRVSQPSISDIIRFLISHNSHSNYYKDNTYLALCDLYYNPTYGGYLDQSLCSELKSFCKTNSSDYISTLIIKTNYGGDRYGSYVNNKNLKILTHDMRFILNRLNPVQMVVENICDYKQAVVEVSSFPRYPLSTDAAYLYNEIATYANCSNRIDENRRLMVDPIGTCNQTRNFIYNRTVDAFQEHLSDGEGRYAAAYHIFKILDGMSSTLSVCNCGPLLKAVYKSTFSTDVGGTGELLDVLKRFPISSDDNFNRHYALVRIHGSINDDCLEYISYYARNGTIFVAPIMPSAMHLPAYMSTAAPTTTTTATTVISTLVSTIVTTILSSTRLPTPTSRASTAATTVAATTNGHSSVGVTTSSLASSSTSLHRGMINYVISGVFNLAQIPSLIHYNVIPSVVVGSQSSDESSDGSSDDGSRDSSDYDDNEDSAWRDRCIAYDRCIVLVAGSERDRCLSDLIREFNITNVSTAATTTATTSSVDTTVTSGKVSTIVPHVYSTILSSGTTHSATNSTTLSSTATTKTETQLNNSSTDLSTSLSSLVSGLNTTDIVTAATSTVADNSTIASNGTVNMCGCGYDVVSIDQLLPQGISRSMETHMVNILEANGIPRLIHICRDGFANVDHLRMVAYHMLRNGNITRCGGDSYAIARSMNIREFCDMIRSDYRVTPSTSMVDALSRISSNSTYCYDVDLSSIELPSTVRSIASSITVGDVCDECTSASCILNKAKRSVFGSGASSLAESSFLRSVYNKLFGRDGVISVIRNTISSVYDYLIRYNIASVT